MGMRPAMGKATQATPAMKRAKSVPSRDTGAVAVRGDTKSRFKISKHNEIRRHERLISFVPRIAD
jgi:hypothetical protein